MSITLWAILFLFLSFQIIFISRHYRLQLHDTYTVVEVRNLNLLLLVVSEYISGLQKEFSICGYPTERYIELYLVQRWLREELHIMVYFNTMCGLYFLLNFHKQ